MPDSPRATLSSGLQALKVEYTEEQVDALIEYIELIKKWNRIDNLTAVDSLDDMVTLHLLDSLTLLPKLDSNLLDVASGAGLPGIPLAVMQPDCKITLIDASAKRVRFLHQVISQLKLSNVTAIHKRLEQYRPSDGFEVITSRAFTALPQFTEHAVKLLTGNGAVIAMKGKYPAEELAALPQQFAYTVEPISLPGLDAERHLVSIRLNES